MKKRIYIVLSITLLCLFFSTTNIYAETTGFDGISKYSSSSGSCAYGDRAGAQYVQNIQNVLGNIMVNKFIYKDSWADENDIKQYSIANTVNFYAYAGHGIIYDNIDNAAHFFAQSNGTSWHNSAMKYNDTVNGKTSECRFGNECMWVTMYTCNWLTNQGSTTKQNNIYSMFEGASLMMGFASTMYLDSREGTLYATYIKQGYKIRDAFISAAKTYQKGHKSRARVIGFIPAKDNTLYNYIGPISSRDWYKNLKSAYGVLDDLLIN